MYTANNIPKIKQVHPQKFQGSGVVAPDRPVCHTGGATMLEVNFLRMCIILEIRNSPIMSHISS